MKRTIRRCIGAAVLAPAVAACGSTDPAPPHPVFSYGPVKGGTFQVADSNKNTYGITLEKVVDPAQSNDIYHAPDIGTRFVGVAFRIQGIRGTAADNADADVTVIGSDQVTYQPYVVSITGYGNFNNGVFSVTAGQVASGAVTFQIPAGVSVRAVHWTVQNIRPEVTWSARARAGRKAI